MPQQGGESLFLIYLLAIHCRSSWTCAQGYCFGLVFIMLYLEQQHHQGQMFGVQRVRMSWTLGRMRMPWCLLRIWIMMASLIWCCPPWMAMCMHSNQPDMLKQTSPGQLRCLTQPTRLICSLGKRYLHLIEPLFSTTQLAVPNHLTSFALTLSFVDALFRLLLLLRVAQLRW